MIQEIPANIWLINEQIDICINMLRLLHCLHSHLAIYVIVLPKYKPSAYASSQEGMGLQALSLQLLL